MKYEPHEPTCYFAFTRHGAPLGTVEAASWVEAKLWARLLWQNDAKTLLTPTAANYGEAMAALKTQRDADLHEAGAR
jgi:hypothetical protein